MVSRTSFDEHRGILQDSSHMLYPCRRKEKPSIFSLTKLVYFFTSYLDGKIKEGKGSLMPRNAHISCLEQQKYVREENNYHTYNQYIINFKE